MDILKEPKFNIIKIEDGNYIFYNSVRHFASNIDEATLAVFDLIYKYKDIDYILKNISLKHVEYVKRVYDRTLSSKALDISCVDKLDYRYDLIKPAQFYLRLTYKCNLGCTYCYNKDIRTNKSSLNIDEWKIIIDKINSSAKHIILTGGEPFLFDELAELVAYIKQSNSQCHIEIISNCMHDFESGKFDDILNTINNITFSCDSLSDTDTKRKNFDSRLFIRNVNYIKSNFGSVGIAISSTFIKNSEASLTEIAEFSRNNGCMSRSVLLAPNTVEDLELMPSIEDVNTTYIGLPLSEKIPMKRNFCGAGFGQCSVDPFGNVFPCQNLHYNAFKYGNLLLQAVDEIYEDREVLYSRNQMNVDNFTVCKDCNVKYLCAGGCRGATYKLHKDIYAFPKELCEYYKAESVAKLSRLKRK